MSLFLEQLPEDLANELAAALQDFFDSLTPDSLLTRETDPSTWRGQGVIAEASLTIAQLERFLATAPDGAHVFFDRFRLLLLIGDAAVGTAGFRLHPDGSFAGLEHLTRHGAADLVERIGAAEQAMAERNATVRLLRVAELYLETLVLLGDGEPPLYAVVSPPGVMGDRALLSHRRFANLCARLIARHEREFPPVL